MIFANRRKDPKFWMVIGTTCLVVALLWRQFPGPAMQLGRNWTDGLQGLLMGISIGINLMAVRLRARQRGSGGSSASCAM